MSTPEDTKAQRRERMMQRVRKLLNMAKDGRGNAHEEETAMRQANKIMAAYGIEEAEVDMAALDSDAVEYGEETCAPDGGELVDGKLYRQVPMFASYLIMGVATHW